MKKRRAVIRVGRDVLEDIFCLKGGEWHHKIATHLPSDTEIITMWYDAERDILNLVVEGSGEPLFEVVEGQTVPALTLAYLSVEKKEPILMELKSEI